MSTRVWKRLVLAGAALLVLAALLVGLWVLPAARADSVAGSVPGAVVIAFGVNIGFGLLAAAGMAAIVKWSKTRSAAWTGRLVVLSLISFLLGLALADAASAYRSHDGLLENVSTLLFVCSAVQLLAGVSAIVGTLIRPRGEIQA